MKVILLYVSSVDGKLTKWGQSQVHEWSSPEDAAHFAKVRKENDLIVMGANTFDAVHPQPEEGTLRVVLTSKPENYKEFYVPKQLEFSNETPEHLIKRLETEGFAQMLLVSGKTLTTQFLKSNLIDELWLTIEPKLFGSGDPLLLDEKLDISLQLQDLKQLNKQGTLLVKYTVNT